MFGVASNGCADLREPKTKCQRFVSLRAKQKNYSTALTPRRKNSLSPIFSTLLHISPLLWLSPPIFWLLLPSCNFSLIAMPSLAALDPGWIIYVTSSFSYRDANYHFFYKKEKQSRKKYNLTKTTYLLNIPCFIYLARSKWNIFISRIHYLNAKVPLHKYYKHNTFIRTDFLL